MSQFRRTEYAYLKKVNSVREGHESRAIKRELMEDEEGGEER